MPNSEITRILIEEKIITQKILNICEVIRKDLFNLTGIEKRIDEVLLENKYISKKQQIYALKKNLEYSINNQKESETKIEAIDLIIQASEAEEDCLSDDSVKELLYGIEKNIQAIQQKQKSISNLKKMVQKPIILETIEIYKKNIENYQAAIENIKNDLKRFSKE